MRKNRMAEKGGDGNQKLVRWRLRFQGEVICSGSCFQSLGEWGTNGRKAGKTKIDSNKKRKIQKTSEDVSVQLQNTLAELELAADKDAELNRQSKPATMKIEKMQLLTDLLSKMQHQIKLLDHNVQTILRKWLEPLPDGNLPNANTISIILKALAKFPIDLKQEETRDQFIISGLGKAVKFLSKSDKGISPNRELAKDLLEQWKQQILGINTGFAERRSNDHRPPAPRSSIGTPGGCMAKASSLGVQMHPMCSDKAPAGHNSCRTKILKKFKHMKAMNGRPLQAMKMRATGR